MRQILLASLIVGAASGQAAAVDTAPPNVEVISVIPRSPDVKPYVMSLPPEGRPERAAVAQKPASPEPDNVSSDYKSRQGSLARE